MFLIFQKAFKKIHHLQLAAKFQHYNLLGITLHWIQGFSGRRTQQSTLQASSISSVSSSIPQCTSLRPLSKLHPFCLQMIASCNASSTHQRKHIHFKIALQQCGKDWLKSFNTNKFMFTRITKRESLLIQTTPSTRTYQCKVRGSPDQQHTDLECTCRHSIQEGQQYHCLSSQKSSTHQRYLLQDIGTYAASVWDLHMDINMVRLVRVQRRTARFVRSVNNYTSSVTKMITALA